MGRQASGGCAESRRNVGESRFHARTGRGGAARVRFFMAAQRSSELIEECPFLWATAIVGSDFAIC